MSTIGTRRTPVLPVARLGERREHAGVLVRIRDATIVTGRDLVRTALVHTRQALHLDRRTRGSEALVAVVLTECNLLAMTLAAAVVDYEGWAAEIDQARRETLGAIQALQMMLAALIRGSTR